MSFLGGIIGVDASEESDTGMSGAMAPIPSLSTSSAASAVSGSGSPQHTVNKGVSPWLVIPSIILVAILAFKIGGK